MVSAMSPVRVYQRTHGLQQEPLGFGSPILRRVPDYEFAISRCRAGTWGLVRLGWVPGKSGP